MQLRFAFALLLLISTFSHASSTAHSGIELDTLPWLTGGYYFSGWAANDHWRYRGVIAKVEVPDAFTEDGFKDKEIQAYAMILDYFPRSDLTGIWYGGGFEYWQNTITNQTDNSTAEYNNTVFTLGLGYVWPLGKSFYINPWAAVHSVIGGDQSIRVGDKIYQQESVTPSASIKLGWTF